MLNTNRLIYPGFWFGKTSEQDALQLARRGVGGFCIYNGTLTRVKRLADNLRAASALEHLFICADYEDGLGRWIAGTAWVLSNLAIGASRSEEIAYQKGLTLAREAKSVGVDWIFAPVLDLCDEPKNPIVNTRSFGADPLLVGRLGAALCRGLTDGGVLNCAKHFPGHGRTQQDSHLVLPTLQRSLAQLQKNELIPFQTALAYADSVMAGHLLLPDLDPQLPASLSPAVMSELLKNDMGFDRLILTDALCMKAIGDEKQAALQALHAGAHILLAPENPLALSDFLQQQNGLQPYVQDSVSKQHALQLRLQHKTRQGLDAADFNRQYASYCVVWHKEPFKLLNEQEVSYLELGNEESFAAQVFLQTLQKNGVRIKKWEGTPTDILLAVSFSNYKAFKGHINLSMQEQQQLSQASKKSRKSIFISFGSPFGTETINTLTTRLFCFSPADEMQQCAADILCGKQTAKGSWPL